MSNFSRFLKKTDCIVLSQHASIDMTYYCYDIWSLCVFLAERIQKTGKVEINKIFY